MERKRKREKVSNQLCQLVANLIVGSAIVVADNVLYFLFFFFPSVRDTNTYNNFCSVTLTADPNSVFCCVKLLHFIWMTRRNEANNYRKQLHFQVSAFVFFFFIKAYFCNYDLAIKFKYLYTTYRYIHTGAAQYIHQTVSMRIFLNKTL